MTSFYRKKFCKKKRVIEEDALLASFSFWEKTFGGLIVANPIPPPLFFLHGWHTIPSIKKKRMLYWTYLHGCRFLHQSFFLLNRNFLFSVFFIFLSPPDSAFHWTFYFVIITKRNQQQETSSFFFYSLGGGSKMVHIIALHYESWFSSLEKRKERRWSLSSSLF